MSEFLYDNRKLLEHECKLGCSGNLILPVRKIAIALTNKCNLYCTMCHFCSKKYKNRTYNNEPPFVVTIEQYKSFFNEDFVEKLISLGDDDNVVQEPIEIDFMHGETFLNPDLYYILQHTKKLLPRSYVNVLGNGTTGPDALACGEQCVRYIDLLGFSIDGATKETFESIRTPAKFDKVISNIQKWSDACTKYKRRND